MSTARMSPAFRSTLKAGSRRSRSCAAASSNTRTRPTPPHVRTRRRACVAAHPGAARSHAPGWRVHARRAATGWDGEATEVWWAMLRAGACLLSVCKRTPWARARDVRRRRSSAPWRGSEPSRGIVRPRPACSDGSDGEATKGWWSMLRADACSQGVWKRTPCARARQTRAAAQRLAGAPRPRPAGRVPGRCNRGGLLEDRTRPDRVAV